MHDPPSISRSPSSDLTAGFACREQWLDLSHGAVVMGILNVTPDSFYDGGKYVDLSEALHRAETMFQEGARIIDVGGASSRPRGSVYGAGAEPVSEECEAGRVVPVIQAIRHSFPEAIISADTSSPQVGLHALDAGAHMINDVSGLQNGFGLAEYAGRVNAAYVIMHSIYQSENLVHEADHPDVVAAVTKTLEEAAQRAHEAGVESVILDPGFGFGKKHEDNLLLINRLDLLTELHYPVLVGISRKSTVGQVLSKDSVPVPTSDRLFGSLGMAAAAILRGAKIIRTHDIRETHEMIQGLEAVLNPES